MRCIEKAALVKKKKPELLIGCITGNKTELRGGNNRMKL